MVLPISTCAPDEPAVAVGVLVWLLSEPQPASPSAKAATAPQAMRLRVRISGRYPIDAVGHTQFTAAVPHGRLAVFVEHGLVVSVDENIVDDVVGDHHVRRTLHGDRPAAAQRVNRVAGAVDEQ